MKKVFLALLCVGIAFSRPLSYEEIKQLGREASKSLLEEYQPKNKPTLIISNISNKADIDLNLLILSITSNIRKSGQYNLINSKESMLKNARGLRDDEEYNPETVIEKGELLAPNLSLSGEISEQTQNGVTTYLLLLTLTDIKTGLLLWDKDITLTQRLDNSIQINTSTPQRQIAEIHKKEVPKKEERTSFFLLGFEGGLGAGVDSSLAYFGGAKIGYAYKSNSLFSFDIYGLYEFYNHPNLQENEKESKKHKSKHSDEEDEELYHALGAGATVKLSILYAGANFLYNLKNAQISYLFDAGLSFGLGIVNLNIGARYTLALSQTVENQFSGVIGLNFHL